MTTLATKLARNEADLISAAAHGSAAFHAVLFSKLAELNLDADDRQAVMDMLTDEREKTAAPGGFGVGHALALGSILAPMAMAGAKWLANRSSYDEGWSNLQTLAPEVIQQDPHRARAIYDLLHSTSPNLATNPVVAADLMRQMTAMPMVDIGSVKTLTEVGKNLGSIDEGQYDAGNRMFDPLDKYKGRAEAFHMLTGGKTASVKLAVKHVSTDGVPCVFDWSTPAMKEAGITDAFTPSFSGSGTALDQANNATQMDQMAAGQSLLPLDAVVRELLAKEMELSQREQILQQQEIQMQQAMAMQQQMAGMYQQQYGVDPSTGQTVGEQAPADQQAQDGQDPNAVAQPEVQDPAAEQAPAQDPTASQPPAEQDMAAAQAPAGQDPAAAQSQVAPEAQDPTAGLPPEAQPAPEGQGQDAGAQPAVAEQPAAPAEPAVPQQDPGASMDPGAPAMPGQGAVMQPDGLHIDIPLPSLHLVIKTAESAADADPLEKERQEAVASFNELFSDIFRP